MWFVGWLDISIHYAGAEDVDEDVVTVSVTTASAIANSVTRMAKKVKRIRRGREESRLLLAHANGLIFIFLHFSSSHLHFFTITSSFEMIETKSAECNDFAILRFFLQAAKF